MRLADFGLGLVLRFVLGGVQRLAGPARRERRRRRRVRAAGSAAVARRGPLLGATLGCFALGLPLMVIFENTFTRIAGVLLMFGFIVCGVFMIADPGFLAGEDEE